ncbi:MAG: methylenetetrahydrofolate reductase [SAR324 cluster bacterium]|nr:methylenetetrahydrofolate reductase [SAR324 cluster bacterium]
MHIRQLFQPGRPLFSIELFPPKTPRGVENLKNRLLQIREFSPEYVSVTYGAAGGTRHNTLEVCSTIKKLGMVAMAHLTCVAHSRGEIDSLLSELKAAGIENIMALRGDPPSGESAFQPPPDGFRYAVELIRAIGKSDSFGIGAAGYPEGHVEAPSYQVNLGHQIEKVRAGAELLVSQFFLENSHFLRWRDDLRAAGVTVPIEAGILPALSAQQITQFCTMCGVAIPPTLLADLEKCGEDKEASADCGQEFSLRQVEDLLKEGVDGIHLYALNRLEPIAAVAPLVRA